VWRKAKHVCLALLLLIATYEVMSFAWSKHVARKAAIGAELLATLRPGSTTMDDAKALFQAHGVNVDIQPDACGAACDGLYLYAANSPRWVIPLYIGRRFDLVVRLVPLPPVKTAVFLANLYFVNGILDSISTVYEAGTTDVVYLRAAGDRNSRSSDWKYESGGMVVTIRVRSSGAASDVPFPHFDFNYMYPVKCVDARMLWPTAPRPATEVRGSLAAARKLRTLQLSVGA
jgi:hypothetical protein